MLIAAGPIGVGKSWIACPRGSGSGGGDLRIPIEGAIVTIDAIGTYKAIAKAIIDKGADYFLALRRTRACFNADVADLFAGPALASACFESWLSDAGHGRIEERKARVAYAACLPSGIRNGRACAPRRDHCDTNRQENRRNLDRNAPVYLVGARDPASILALAGRIGALKKQPVLAARRHFPRG